MLCRIVGRRGSHIATGTSKCRCGGRRSTSVETPCGGLAPIHRSGGARRRYRHSRCRGGGWQCRRCCRRRRISPGSSTPFAFRSAHPRSCEQVRRGSASALVASLTVAMVDGRLRVHSLLCEGRDGECFAFWLRRVFSFCDVILTFFSVALPAVTESLLIRSSQFPTMVPQRHPSFKECSVCHLIISTHMAMGD